MLLVLIVCRGILYRSMVTYKSLGQRMTYEITNDRLRQYIKDNCPEKDSTGIKEIIESSLSLTSKTLRFTFSESDSNPNKLIDSQQGNCIGYAAFFSAICNYRLEQLNLSGQWSVQSEIGQLYIFGQNIHRYFRSVFFKNHDFVIIKNKKTNETYAVDPSIHDYLYINFVTTL